MLRQVFESGRPITYVRSPEEQRVGRILREVGQGSLSSTPLPVWEWTLTEGMRGEDGCAAETHRPRAALDFIVAHESAAIFHLKDFHEPLRDSSEIRRRLRDVYQSCLDRAKFVVITSPVRFIPEEIERSLVYLELRPPDLIELVEFLRDEARRISAGGGSADATDATLHGLARVLQGLTLDEARHAVRRALAESGRLEAGSLPALLEEKRLLVNRSGVVEYIADTTGMGEVGGLETLKTWLGERRKLFQLRDDLSADVVPKGVLVMGVPGCGKSLSIKAIASHFELPLYRIDMIEVFSGRHGSPEGAFVSACRMLEEMAPAVVWFDEIEMGITAAESGGEQGRIFAFFLTWMQEKARGLFVAATANRIDLLPAEMIRKGRFDEVFFVDLPLDHERAEIFRIHLHRRGLDASRYDLEQLARLTKAWTGAEIEQCVVSAVTRARLADRDVTERDLIDVAVAVVPLSRTMKEQIEHIRRWAHERAVRASPR
jgi:ATPase family associated with various cellular activities (AAA)